MALTSAARSGRTGGAPSVQAGSPLPTRERRPGYVALAVVLIVGLAAVGAWLYAGAGAKTPVIVVVQDVPLGQKIQRSDLSTVAVAGNITALDGRKIDDYVGLTAAIPLRAEMILQRSMVTQSLSLAPGASQVGIALKSGQLPADGVAPGDLVKVLLLPADDAASRTQLAQPLVSAGVRVSAVRADPAETGGIILTLDVPESRAGAIAVASGLGHLAVIKVGS